MPGEMSERKPSTSSVSSTEAELYFLIARFLSNGPCKQAADVLLRELGEHELLPKGIDWKGNERIRSYDQLVRSNRHISTDYLLQLCSRVGPLLDQLVPSNIHGIRSLLGAGNLSLLRTSESIKFTKWRLGHQMALHHGCPRVPPHNLMVPSLVQAFHARTASGACSTVPSSMYSKVTMHDRKLGHLSAVYCVSYDRTGNYIFTGADDALVKIWHAHSGRLLATLRGHASEITDMAVNYENTLLASGSCDKMVRVWCLRTKAPLAILHGHTGAINTLQFSPQCRGDTRVLVSAGADGCVCFWLWSVSKCTFNSKPIKFVERSHAGAQMLCSSFSPGGMFLATGNSDHVIRVYFLHAQAPEKICELEAHTNKVDSMCYSNNYNRFVSGSEDGTARIWRYERQEWRAIVLNMATKLNSDGTEVVPDGSSISVRVTMVCWNVDDSLVMTAVSDFSVKVWDANNGKLLHVLQSHQDEVFVLEGSPVDGRIVVSAGHDGHIIIWDVVAGVKIKSFFNSIQGQGFGAVYDCKFTPDGQSFAATDSHGHLLFFGFGVNEKIKQVPQEVFFHTDYRPLIRDANSYVLDEQTQQPPHLMPSPFLVNIDGNPYPPALQRLVPGRENLKETQLVPEIGINEAGDSEVIGDGAGAPNQEHPHHVPHLPEPAAIPQQNGVVDDDTEDEGEDEAGQIHDRVRPSIDELIRQLQQEQDQRILAQGGEVPLASPPPPDRRASSSFEGRVGMRRSGETEGVRQSLGSVSQRATSSDLAAWRKRVVVRELDKGVLKTTEDKRTAFADEEIRKFITERKKKPSVPNTPSTLFGQVWKGKQTSGKGETNSSKKQPEADLEVTARNRLTTRALYDTEEEEEEEAAFDALPSDYSDSGEYSDWIMEGSSNLQPPKRRSQRKPKRKHISSSDDDDDEDEANLVVDDDDDDDTTDDDDDDDHEEYKQSTKQEPKEKSKKKVFMPSGKGKSKKPYKQKVIVPKNFPKVTELQEEFRPPEWLTGTIPRKTPYVPQMGDEVMYFRQGHELYLQAVQRHKAYEINPNVPMPWDKMPLREMELVKIVGIRYEVKPPRLCNLKLAFLNPDTGKLMGRSFSIRYHDMPDVIDFLVLRQNFDISFKRKWKPGDRFRSMIDDQWWMGKIESQSPLNPLFPDSHFQSLYVHWDNGEFERLSPWDMEPINNNLVPSDVGGGVPVDNEELRSLLYSPKPGEWSSEGREIETERILCGIEAVIEHSAAEPFNAPVDLNAFPEYGIIIEYPIDLSTIKARLENGYYRRINALQWDIRHIESNAKKFNEDGTSISRSASIITETLLQFIGNKECRDPMPILDRLSHGLKFHWGKDKAANSSSDEATSSSGGSKRKRVEDVDEGSNSSKRQCIEAYRDPLEWKERCWELLGIMLECEDAEPFKEPVNTNDYPDYLAVVEVPMDFGTVGCRLQNGHYTNPLDFAEDVRLIFSNSRLYNPNKRSRIYTMTIRLSAMFEERIRKILTAYRAATKSRKQTATPSNRAGTSSSSAAAERAKAFAARVQSRVSGSTSQDGERSGTGPSTSRVPPSRKTGDDRAKHRSASPSKKRPRVKDDSDDDNTEVENGDDDDDTEEEDYKGEENKATDFDGPRRADASSDKENYKDDDDTEIEDNAHPGSTQNGKVRSRGSSHSAGQAQLSNGHPKYRTRAKTGSLKPKRYASSEEEDEKDLRSRKNNKRAESLSSRDSSIHFPDDEDDDDDDDESGTTSSSSSSDSDSSSDGEKKSKSKSGRQHQPKSRRKTKIKSQKIKQKQHRSAASSDDDSNDEESSESDSDSDSSDDTPPQRRAAQPKGRATLDVRKGHSGGSSKNHSSGSGTRTTRNQGKRTVHYLEDSEDDCYEDASHLSVSSRGRLRKMTKRARALHDD